MKKIVSLFALFLTFMGTAQIVEPVKWTSSVVKVSDTELDLIISASIENNWHLYSQFTADGGALPLVFTFKNQKGNYQLVGKTKEGKFKDDNEFPISNDLLFYIVNNIVTKEYPLINKPDGEEIGIQKEQDKQN